MIKVFFLDEARVTIEGLLASLAEYDDIESVGSSSSPEEAISKLDSCDPDIVLMESQFSSIEGPLLARKIIDQWKNIKIVTYSASDDKKIVSGMVEAGALGYILKREDVYQIVKGIRLVSQGKKWFSPELVSVMLEQINKKSLSDYGLSTREEEVFNLVLKGLTNHKIADELNIAEGTVKNHVSSIYGKLNLSSRLDAIRWAIDHNFLES